MAKIAASLRNEQDIYSLLLEDVASEFSYQGNSPKRTVGFRLGGN